jgi:hypothetical protein
MLDEPAVPTTQYGVQRLYTDRELTDWINDGCRDIARRTEDLANTNTTTPVIVGTAAYALPTDTIRLHRVDFQPTGSTQVYPIEIRNRNEIDQLIGFNPTIQSSYPWVCWLWGTPGNVTFPLTVTFYPVFSTGGTLSLWYFRMPVRIADPTVDPSQYQTLVETVEGWDDLVVEYAMTRALQKARNPEWQQRKQEYEAQLASMVDVTRQYHDQANRMLGSRERWSMDWLYGFEVS